MRTKTCLAGGLTLILAAVLTTCVILIPKFTSSVKAGSGVAGGGGSGGPVYYDNSGGAAGESESGAPYSSQAFGYSFVDGKGFLPDAGAQFEKAREIGNFGLAGELAYVKSNWIQSEIELLSDEAEAEFSFSMEAREFSTKKPTTAMRNLMLRIWNPDATTANSGFDLIVKLNDYDNTFSQWQLKAVVTGKGGTDGTYSGDGGRWLTNTDVAGGGTADSWIKGNFDLNQLFEFRFSPTEFLKTTVLHKVDGVDTVSENVPVDSFESNPANRFSTMFAAGNPFLGAARICVGYTFREWGAEYGGAEGHKESDVVRFVMRSINDNKFEKHWESPYNYLSDTVGPKLYFDTSGGIQTAAFTKFNFSSLKGKDYYDPSNRLVNANTNGDITYSLQVESLDGVPYTADEARTVSQSAGRDNPVQVVSDFGFTPYGIGRFRVTVCGTDARGNVTEATPVIVEATPGDTPPLCSDPVVTCARGDYTNAFFTVDLNGGGSPVLYGGSTTPLESGSYTLSAGKLAFTDEYLNTLPIGANVFVLNTDGGAINLVLIITDDTPAVANAPKTFDKSRDGSLTLVVDLKSREFQKLMQADAEVEETYLAWNPENTLLTIAGAYLSQLSSGEKVFRLYNATGKYAEFTVTITDKTPIFLIDGTPVAECNYIKQSAADLVFDVDTVGQTVVSFTVNGDALSREEGYYDSFMEQLTLKHGYLDTLTAGDYEVALHSFGGSCGTVTIHVKDASSTQYQVTVTGNDGGAGSVSGGGSYTEGTKATLVAEAAEGYRFLGWYEENELVSNQATYQFTVDGDREIQARFVRTWTVSVTNPTPQSGEIGGAGRYDDGAVATLTATANAGYVFAGWKVDGSVVDTDAEYRVTVTRDISVEAVFAARYEIDVVADDDAHGEVLLTGSGVAGSSMTATATACAGYRFVQWEINGQSVSSDAEYTFTAEKNAVLTAVFEELFYQITVTAGDSAYGSVRVEGGTRHAAGTDVTVIAAPGAAYEFIGWKRDGETVSALARYTFQVTGDTALVAVFAPKTAATAVTVTVGSQNDDMGTVSGGGEFAAGTQITVSAVAKEGYRFVGWLKDGETVSTDADYSLTASEDIELVAVFEKEPAEGSSGCGCGSSSAAASGILFTVACAVFVGKKFV